MCVDVINYSLRVLLVGLATLIGYVGESSAQTPAARIDEALQNITTVVRAKRVGYATIWDGNKFVQCRRLTTGDMRCEAAGTNLQPSLKSVLTADALKRMAALGWKLNPNFGNYEKDFAAGVPTTAIAENILKTLTQAYAANGQDIELSTRWVADVTCPPRAGFSQNLAGSINDTLSMRSVAIRSCSYASDPRQDLPPAASLKTIIARYGAQTTSEIQRLRLNSQRRVWVVISAGLGYVQCAPGTSPPVIYCEAQSAESWPALAAVLTPERRQKLKRAGYADPGRAPNYSRNYPTDTFSDAAIASQVLTVLHDVYGYNGVAKLEFEAERTRDRSD